MFGNFLRRLTDHKQRVNKKETVEIDSPASNRGQGKYLKYFSFPCRRLRQHYQLLTLGFFVKTIFEKELIKIKEIAINVE
jgi:hypothetical protein